MCSRAKIHNVSSLLAWPVVFADTNSRILATIGESLLFIIPADKKRALQTLEVPLNPDMQWNKRPFERWRSDSVGLKQEVELRLQLRNTGFYIFNGSKNAVDEVALSFSTEDDCDSFCETMARSLQNLPSQSAALGKPRPKKQSKAVMIDLSQDVVISGDTQLLSQPLGVPHKVSASRRIDMSTSRETSMSSSSLREINEEEFLPLQPRKDQERLLHDTRQVQRDSPHSSKVEAKMTPSGVKLEKLPLDSVAPAFEDTTSQGRPTAEDRKDHLPQQEDDNIAAPKFTVATSESLQHLAFNALRHSARISNRTTANRAESNSRSEECEKAPDTALSGDSSLRPPSSPRTQPHLAKKMALKSTKQVTSTSKTTLPSQTKPPESKTSTNLPNRRRAANSVPKGEEAVDWDEDLKSDGNDHEDESSLASRSKRSVSRNTKDGVKKHATTKKIPGTSGTRKKAPSKAKVKESKPQPTSTNTGIGATRSRRAAANIAYVEQSEEEEQSQDSLDGAKDVPSPVQPKPVEAATAGSNTNNDDNQPQPPLADGPNLINVVRSPDAEARSTHVSAEQTVEVHASSEGIPALAEQDIERTATERGPNDQSGSETSAPGTQKSNDTVTSIDATKSKVQAAVEVVDDSHPLEKKQLANIVGAARKSFGSALMDVMNEIGMQPIQSASVVGVRTKPFGDKVAFVESVKTALEQSPSKSPVKKPGSARTKHIQTPSTNKSKPEASTGQQFTRTHLEATRPNEPVQSGVFAPDPPLDEGIGVPISPQKTSAAEPTRETERANSPNGSLSLAPGETFDLQQPQASKAENGQQASEANKSSPSSHQLPEKPISPAKTDHLPPVSFSRDRTTTLHNNERKRRSDVPVRSPKRTKRARMTNPDPHKSQRDADLKEGLPLQSHPTAESRGHAAPNRLRRLEPSARDLGKTAHTDKAPIKALVLQKQKPADTAEPQSVHPKNKSPTRIPNPPEPQAQTPQLIPGDGQQRLLPDDNLNRKAHLVGFSAKGPRNQGMLSSDARRRGVEQSGSVPTEKHKHLAFKKLHAGSKADEHPTEAVLNQNQLSNGDRKHRVSFSFSEPESINDDLHVDQDNAKDTLAAPNTAKAENGKSASQTSKVDENGSPRLHLRETSRLSLPSNDPAASDDSEDLDENMDSASIFEDSEVESASFGLTAVVTKFTVKMQKVAKIKPVRSRPSIGLGKLLDQSFPQASTKIATGAFKAPVPADTTVLNEASPKPRGTKYLNHNQTMIQKLESGGRPDKPIAVNQDVTPSFDIENLNVSVAQEQPSSSATGRVRRLRSSTPQSPGPEKPQPDDSPPSFNTRLGKMIMPPPPRKERDKVVTPEDYGGGLHKGREQSAMIDAETTLVNGEAFEEDTNQSSPPRHQKSSSSEEENKGGPSISVSQQAAVGTLQRDRRIWNQKVAETQQTVLEILNQVSRVSAFKSFPKTILIILETPRALFQRGRGYPIQTRSLPLRGPQDSQ